MLSQSTESIFRAKQPGASLRVQVHFVGFAILLIGWTIALLVPIPKKTASVVLETEDAMFWFGKCLHIGAYAFLTITGISLPWSRKQRLWLLAGLVVHGAATEFIQQFVGRGASVRDVFLDATGITIGWAVWSAWTARFRNRLP